MIKLAILLFVVAAIFGLVMLTATLKNKPKPKPVILIHGGIAIVGILLLTFVVMNSTGLAPTLSLALFIAVALGGLTLFTMNRLKKPIPKWLTLLHPLGAVIALTSLILFVSKIHLA